MYPFKTTIMNVSYNKWTDTAWTVIVFSIFSSNSSNSFLGWGYNWGEDNSGISAEIIDGRLPNYVRNDYTWPPGYHIR